MSDDQFQAFLEAVAADSSLQEKLNSVADADAVIAAAKEAGFMISAEAVENNLKKKMEEMDPQDLTAEDLEAVAGGAFFVAAGKNGWIEQRPVDNRPVSEQVGYLKGGAW